jgi:hypothetical protein
MKVRVFLLLALFLLPTSGVGQAATPNDGRHDFDFLVGAWNIANHRQKNGSHTEWVDFPATTVCRLIIKGLGNMDEMTLPNNGQGTSLRFFDPTTKEWSIYWATSRRGLVLPPVIGHFENGVGLFYSNDVDADNKPVKVRFKWSDVSAKSARWEQAFSQDNGKTWELNWIMTFTRQERQ